MLDSLQPVVLSATTPEFQPPICCCFSVNWWLHRPARCPAFQRQIANNAVWRKTPRLLTQCQSVRFRATLWVDMLLFRAPVKLGVQIKNKISATSHPIPARQRQRQRQSQGKRRRELPRKGQGQRKRRRERPKESQGKGKPAGKGQSQELRRKKTEYPTAQ